MKQCRRCEIIKPEGEFSKRTASPDGLNYICKQCVIEVRAEKKERERRHKVYQDALKADARKDANLQRHYGMSLEDYHTRLSEQGDRCAICGRDQEGFVRAFAVDHDHVTGRVRGILCPDCNRGLGGFQDNPNLLRRAADYLERKELP